MLPLVIGIYASLKSFKLGFTLIEILVVLLIIGLSFTFAFLAFGDFGRGRNVSYTAHEMKSIVELYRDKAVVESSNYILITTPHGYKIFQDLNAYPLKVVSFPSYIVSSPSLKIEILSSRYITPFTIFFGTNSHKPTVKLIGQANGDLKIEE